MSRKLFVIVLVLFSLAGCDSKTKDELYAEGLKQKRNGNTNGAIVLFKNALEKDQHYLKARFQLALAYKASGKYEQAEQELRKIQRQDLSRKELLLELAKVHSLMAKPDQVIAEIVQLLKMTDETPETLELLGSAYAQKNRLDIAETYLLKSLRADPTRWTASIALAGVYMQSGRSSDAIALLTDTLRINGRNIHAWRMLARIETRLGNRQKALEAYNRIIEINPEDTEALFKAGLICLEKEDLTRAGNLADNLASKFPNRPEGFLLKGLVFYYGKDFGKAVVELQKSLRIKPDPRTYYYLGLSHYQLKEMESSLSQFQKVLDYNPSFTSARLMVSLILLNQKRLDDALIEAGKVLRQNSNPALAHNIIGSVFMAKERYDEALAEFDRAIELEPNLVDTHMKKGLYYLAQGMPRQAESELQNAVRLSPGTLNGRSLLAVHYLKQRNYQKAISTLQEGIKGEPADAILYTTMAGAYLALQKTPEALTALQKAKLADPDYPAPYINLARYYHSVKDYGRALAEYQAILKRNPGNIQGLLGAASILEVAGKDEKAFEYYEKAAETRQRAGYLALAGYYVRRRDTGRARAVLEEAAKADPRDDAALEAKGKLLFFGKQYKDAAKDFEALEKINPDRALPFLVQTYEAMNESAKAEAASRRIIARSPKSVEGYLALASVYSKRNDLDRAIKVLKQGLASENGTVPVKMMLGNLYERKRQFFQALQVYGDVQRQAPGYFAALFAEGVVYEQMGAPEKAIGKYQQILDKSDTYVPALNNLAYLYADGPENLRRQALRFSARAYRLAPGHPGIMDTYGYALLRNGKSREAASVLEQCAALLPLDPTVRYHLALAYASLGDSPRAVQSLQRVLQAKGFPASGKARELLITLGK